MQVSQAVILCGGRGERLRPLTENLPKPMVNVLGRPFLQFLLDQLSENGIKKFVLLTGYFGEKIVECFGDGSKWGWSITYSHGPVEWLTAKRIHEALDQIDNEFLLLYSDNFAHLRLKELKQININTKQKNLTSFRKYKTNLALSRLDVFKAFYNIKEGDGMYWHNSRNIW